MYIYIALQSAQRHRLPSSSYSFLFSLSVIVAVFLLFVVHFFRTFFFSLLFPRLSFFHSVSIVFVSFTFLLKNIPFISFFHFFNKSLLKFTVPYRRIYVLLFRFVKPGDATGHKTNVVVVDVVVVVG